MDLSCKVHGDCCIRCFHPVLVFSNLEACTCNTSEPTDVVQLAPNIEKYVCYERKNTLQMEERSWLIQSSRLQLRSVSIDLSHHVLW